MNDKGTDTSCSANQNSYKAGSSNNGGGFLPDEDSVTVKANEKSN